MTNVLLILGTIVILLITLLPFILKFSGLISARIQKDKLGKEKYNELKNDFDARRIMGELNYIIDEIAEYQEQLDYVGEKPAKSTGGQIFRFFTGFTGQTREEIRLFNLTKKALDAYIKKSGIHA